MAGNLVAEKLAQATAILNELDIDLWMLVARESDVLGDPSLREGIEPWGFALGHQMGRACHDGGCLLGPRWERYGDRPNDRVEKDHVYTLEIGMSVPGYGRVSLEEDVVVTEDGCEFMAPPQRELILIG